jgi:hypothetical protein
MNTQTDKYQPSSSTHLFHAIHAAFFTPSKLPPLSHPINHRQL